MKKAIACFAALTLGVSMLSACGSTAESASEAVSAAESVVSEAEAASSAASAAESTAESVAASEETEVFGETEVILFAAKSLNTVLEDSLIAAYNEIQPNVKITGSYDSSGTLMTQIQEGATCDVFFSAAQKQMNTLEEEGLLVDGTRVDVVNNQVCVVTYADSGTKVTGIENLGDASSLAIAAGSVPVGKYTRQALVNLGVLEEVEDVSEITTEEISAALGVEDINECKNVGEVTAAVAEGSNEVGTVYYSDTYGFEDRLVILEKVSYDLTGNVIYPAAQVVNPEADELEQAAAADFVQFLKSDTAKEILESYYFDVNV